MGAIPPIDDLTALAAADWQGSLRGPSGRPALLIPPIGTHGAFYGLVTLGSLQAGRFTEDDIPDVRAITTQVASVSENAEIYRLINRQAQELGSMLRLQQEKDSKS